MPAMGHMIIATSTKAASSSSSSFLPILLIIVVMVAIYWTMSRRNRARQAAQANTALVPGQPARTTSGMYGTISSVEGDDVLLEVHPGVTIRMMKRAVVPVAGTGPGMNGSSGRTEEPAEDDDDDHDGSRTEDSFDDGDHDGSRTEDSADEDSADSEDRVADEASADDLSTKDR
jgi:preprotein translocase subunit YajC